MLRAFILAAYDYAGWEVCYAYGAVGGINVLTSGAA